MLGKRLKDLRGKRTQEDIANLIGISRARYSHYENGRSEPDTETLQKMADLFNVSTDYLLGRTEEKTGYLESYTQSGKSVILPYRLTIKNKLPDANIVKISDEKLGFSKEELKILEEIKKHPVLFHDLANAPEKKIKQLIKMWEFIKKDLDADDEDDEDIIDD